MRFLASTINCPVEMGTVRRRRCLCNHGRRILIRRHVNCPCEGSPQHSRRDDGCRRAITPPGRDARQLPGRAHTPRARSDAALAPFDGIGVTLMRARIERRARRQRERERIVPPADATIGGTDDHGARCPSRPVRRRRDPRDLAAPVDPGHRARDAAACATAESIRNVAYALLSGADGWMSTAKMRSGRWTAMSLDNQRNLKLAYARADVFMTAAEQGRRRDERLG